MKEYPELIAREQESILKQEARALCIRYAQCTKPGYGLSFDPARAEGMARRISSEVNRVFLTRQQGGRIYDLMMRRSPQLAKAYWNAWKKQDTRTQTRLLRDAGLTLTSLNTASHKASRTGPGSRVPKNFQPTDMVSEPQLRAFARQQAALVGFAQAGWYAAARGLGGRIRVNHVAADGKRSTEEAFPPYIRKLANKFPGIGGARVLTTGASSSVEIWTNVRHASTALPGDLETNIVAEAQQNVAKALLESVKAMNKQKFNVA